MSKQCSFCGTTEDTNVKLLEGAEANICQSCAVLSLEEFEEIQETSITKENTFMKPHQIKEELDKYIVGQDEAKKILAVAVYNHYKRINKTSKVDIQKTNIMLIGPTGSGKTYLMQTLATILNLPIVIVDSTSLTEAGYIGDDVESILEKLLQKAEGDVKKAEKGIVYIDEIDKIANRTSEGRKNTRDISGQGVQQALLKMVEDSEVHINISGSVTSKRKVAIQTKNILFVCGGAFVGIEELVKKRIEPKKTSSIGFQTETEQTDGQLVDMEKDITQQDIVDFGFIPEFVGRIPVVAVLQQLSKEDLSNILTKPKNSIIKQYQALFRMDGIKLTFHKNAIDHIVEEASRKNVGARGLKGVIEKRMYDIMFELPQQEDVTSYTITKELLVNK